MASMFSLTSTPCTVPTRPNQLGHLAGQVAGPGADVEHPLAGQQVQPRGSPRAAHDVRVCRSRQPP